jgi:hypothetical protein
VINNHKTLLEFVKKASIAFSWCPDKGKKPMEIRASLGLPFPFSFVRQKVSPASLAGEGGTLSYL